MSIKSDWKPRAHLLTTIRRCKCALGLLLRETERNAVGADEGVGPYIQDKKLLN